MDKEKEIDNKKRGISENLVVAIFSLLMFFSVGYFAKGYFSNSIKKGNEKIIAEGLKKNAADLNKKTPIQIDDSITLNGVAASGKSFSYKYTIKASDLNSETLQNKLKSETINNFCNQTESRLLFENGVELFFRYTDVKGHAFQFSIKNCPE